MPAVPVLRVCTHLTLVKAFAQRQRRAPLEVVISPVTASAEANLRFIPCNSVCFGFGITMQCFYSEGFYWFIV